MPADCLTSPSFCNLDSWRFLISSGPSYCISREFANASNSLCMGALIEPLQAAGVSLPGLLSSQVDKAGHTLKLPLCGCQKCDLHLQQAGLLQGRQFGGWAPRFDRLLATPASMSFSVDPRSANGLLGICMCRQKALCHAWQHVLCSLLEHVRACTPCCCAASAAARCIMSLDQRHRDDLALCCAQAVLGHSKHEGISSDTEPALCLLNNSFRLGDMQRCSPAAGGLCP